MSKLSYRFSIILLLCLVLVSCINSAKENQEQPDETMPFIKESNFDAPLLYKNWKVREGKRAGKETQSLEGIFVNISTDSLLTNFNVNLEEQTQTYHLQGNKIITPTQNPLFLILDLAPQQLHVKSTLKGTTFELLLEPTASQETNKKMVQ